MGVPPLRIEVYNKAFQMKGPIGAPTSLTVIPRFNGIGGFGTANFVIPANHPRAADLTADGARVRFLDDRGQHVMSGRITSFRGTGPQARANLEFFVLDDLSILNKICGWVVPSGAITAQGTAGTNWTMVGPAETVLKAAVAQNGVTRLGLPISMAATAGRGATVKASLRFQPLYERLFPVVDGAGIEKSGIGVEMRLVPNAGLELYVSTPSVRAQPLTEEGGVLTEWSFSSQAATDTRGVVGGQGEGTLRLFREKSQPALETALGWKYEFYRDARDSNDPTVLYSRLDETFAETAQKAGLEVTLAETENFRYGRSVKVGDTVTIVVGGRTITETLNEVTLSWTASGGYQTRPRVGNYTDSTDASIISAIRSIARSMINRNTER